MRTDELPIHSSTNLYQALHIPWKNSKTSLILGVAMQKVRLGKTGLQVSRVGMGGIPILLPPLDTAVRVIERGLDLGINLIDTSVYYDDSEVRIGKALEGHREEVVVVTKCSWRSAKATKSALEKSLRQLNTDYLDVWLFHNVSTEKAYQTMLRPTEPLFEQLLTNRHRNDQILCLHDKKLHDL